MSKTNMSMSRKTIGLIVGLVIISGILFYVALSQTTSTPKQPVVVMKPSPAHSVLSMSAEPTTGNYQTVDVNINTYTNSVTAVQLELAYDPKIISNVRIAPGTFLDQPVQLINNIDQKTGLISYAFGIAPTGSGKKGQGTVAKISFYTLSSATQPATLTFTPKTKVAAEGVSQSVLKSAMNFSLPSPTK